MVDRRRRVKYVPKKTDLLFVIGASSFLSQVINTEVPSKTIIIASLILMGVPVFGRLTNGNGNGKDKP